MLKFWNNLKDHKILPHVKKKTRQNDHMWKDMILYQKQLVLRERNNHATRFAITYGIKNSMWLHKKSLGDMPILTLVKKITGHMWKNYDYKQKIFEPKRDNMLSDVN